MVEYLTSLAFFTVSLTQLYMAYDKQVLMSRSAKGSTLMRLSAQRILAHVVPGCACSADSVETKIVSELKPT